MGKVKTLPRLPEEDAAARKRAAEAFAAAHRKVRTLHANLFRRLAEYDRQKDGR